MKNENGRWTKMDDKWKMKMVVIVFGIEVRIRGFLRVSYPRFPVPPRFPISWFLREQANIPTDLANKIFSYMQLPMMKYADLKSGHIFLMRHPPTKQLLSAIVQKPNDPNEPVQLSWLIERSRLSPEQLEVLQPLEKKNAMKILNFKFFENAHSIRHFVTC